MLSEAVARLEAGDLDRAVPALLSAWRACPDPRLADALDALSPRIARPPIAGKTQIAKTRELVALVRAGDPLDQPRIAALLGATTWKTTVEQLAALLAHWPADPRFTHAIVRMLERRPFASLVTEVWEPAFALLARDADQRLLSLVPAIDFAAHGKDTRWNFQERADGPARFARWAADLVAAVQARHPTVPRIADEGIVQRLVELASPTTVTALRDDVLARPDTAGNREVLGDKLLELGDPRGRLIALDGVRTPAAARERRALIDEHAERWLGSLGGVVDPATARFDRGFPVACDLAPAHPRLPATIGDPAWATVRRIRLMHYSTTPVTYELLLHSCMRSLEGVTGIHTPPPRSYPWSHVGLVVADPAALDLEHLGRQFPRMTGFLLETDAEVERYEWLWREPFTRFSTIGVSTNATARERVPPLLERALARLSPDTTFELEGGRYRGFRLRLSAQRRVLDIRGGHYTKLGPLTGLAAPLRGTLSTIRVHGRALKAERAALEALLAPGGAIELVVDDRCGLPP
jgi:hypothetical protein